MQPPDNQERLPNRIEVIARHGRIRTQRQRQAEFKHFGSLAVADIAHGLVHGRARSERDFHVPFLQHMQLLGIYPAHVEQQHVGTEQTKLLKAGNITHAVFKMRGDGLVPVFASMADDSDTAFLGELAKLAEQVIRARNRNADREPSLEPTIE